MAGREVLTTELFLKSNLERYLQTKVVTKELLRFVFQERLWILAWICVLSTLRWKKIFVIGMISVLGCVLGMVTVAAVLQLGMMGILLCIAGLLPQWFFYGMICYMLCVHWYNYPERSWNHIKSVFVITMFIIGILMEVYVNPVCVKWVLKMICK